MPRPGKNMSKTKRMLLIYHMFRFNYEVSMLELRNNLKGWSDKTFSRDIAVLKQAGIPIHFSARRKAFVLVDEAGNVSPKSVHRAPPDFPDGKKERQFIEKILRLTTIMSNVPKEDCDVWYSATFPGASKRTMQRDFAALSDVGYKIFYKRGWDFGPEEDDDPPRHYYFDEEAVYEGDIFSRLDLRDEDEFDKLDLGSAFERMR